MIFCVEDDSSIRDLMIYTLSSAGFEAEGFVDGEALFDALKTRIPQLIMLDIMLPGEDGITILKKLRSQVRTAQIPIIMATAKGTEYDKVIGLDLGADDYLTKPFGMMEMVSRIKAVLRRAAPAEENRTLRVLKEYELLRLFMENLGRAYTRDQLLSKIWGADYIGETRTVDVHIGTLRTKLGSCGDYIETVRGVGYRMEGKI